MKGNVIQMNTLHLNSVRLNGIGKVQSVSLKGGSTEDPVFPPVEPPVEPTPTYTLSASVTNGKVSATRNGSAVNLPFTANEGDVIVLEVTPNDGYTFEGWADGNTDNPRSITMTADVALSAQCVEVVQPPVGNYIQFEDAEVERVLMANGVSSDGVGITKEDAERVTSIGTWFKGNTAITSFKEFAFFKNCTSLYGVFNGGAFYGCTNLVSIILPSSLAEIMQFAFQNCSALANVEGLENVVNIGQGAFAGCPLTNVEELHLASLEGSMSKRTFNGMSHSHRIVDLGKITAISATQYNDYIFGSGATYLRLPSTIESISSYAFNNLTKLETIICEATTPPTIISSFNGSTCPIYVPDASLEAYKTAVNWSAYADRIHPLSEIEGSPYIQFEDAEVERVLMAKGVSSDGIGITKEDAENVASIGTWFYRNTSIMSFNEFGNFTSITALNDNAFRDASNLQFLTIPPNVASIGWRALGYCSNLNTLVILNNASVIQALNNTLEGMKVSNAIYVADSLVESYKTAAYWSAFADKIKPLSEYNG